MRSRSATLATPWLDHLRRGVLGTCGLVLAAMLAGCGPAPSAPPAAVPDVPARRIVTLAPHLAELVHEAGAGDRLVGVVEFSDFPPPVRALPRIGDAFRVDYEAVLALRPDLVLAWTSGNPPETVERLRALGLRVEALEPVALGDIAAHIERIGALTSTTDAASGAAVGFRSRLAGLSGAGHLRPVTVFVQLAERPWFTVTDRHFLGQGLRLCGGENVFGSLPGITAVVSLEAIIAASPQVIVASDMGGEGSDPLAAWSRWPELPAVKNGQLYLVDADLLSRPGVRILDGIEALCADLDRGRGPQSSLGGAG